MCTLSAWFMISLFLLVLSFLLPPLSVCSFALERAGLHKCINRSYCVEWSVTFFQSSISLPWQNCWDCFWLLNKHGTRHISEIYKYMNSARLNTRLWTYSVVVVQCQDYTKLLRDDRCGFQRYWRDLGAESCFKKLFMSDLNRADKTRADNSKTEVTKYVEKKSKTKNKKSEQ